MRLFEGTPFDRPLRCDQCGELEPECCCPEPVPEFTPPDEQTATLFSEKRKKGKQVSIVSGLAADQTDLPGLLSILKTTCGAGGTLKENVIEVQGNHISRIAEKLQEIGYHVKMK